MCRPTTFTERRNIIWNIVNAVSLVLLIIAVSLLAILLTSGIKDDNETSTSTNHLENFGTLKPTNHEEYYTAVVVESVPPITTNTAEKLSNNIRYYEGIIDNCTKHHSPDIIVFPESGLVGSPHEVGRDALVRDFATVIPSPESNIKPCKLANYSEALSKMSCAAENHRVYIVVNLYEKEVICTPNVNNLCTPGNGTLLYNTNVAFDRNGKIIARYRKFNLYNERATLGINSTQEPQLSTFTTDFNITFGMIICFDILFKQPSTDLIGKMKVTDMIFSGAMYTEFPFLALTSLGAGWSYAMNTNLLLSDIGGSGIYAGRRNPLSILMQGHNDTRYLWAKVPIKRHDCDSVYLDDSIEKESLIINTESNNGTISSDFSMEVNSTIYPFNRRTILIDSSLSNFTVKNLTQNAKNMSNELRSSDSFIHLTENFTCKIDVVWNSNNSSKVLKNYKLVAYSGTRNFSSASVNNYVAACGLILCAGENSTNVCILPPDFATRFNLEIMSIDIFVVLVSNETVSTVIPSTLNSNLYPLKTSQFTFKSDVKNTGGKFENIIRMHLVKPVSNLVTFAAYSLPKQSTPDPQGS